MALTVNGATRQKSNTEQMVFVVSDLVSLVSQFMTLVQCDVISTGTPPGVGLVLYPPAYLKRGDVVALGIRDLGEVSTRGCGLPRNEYSGAVLTSASSSSTSGSVAEVQKARMNRRALLHLLPAAIGVATVAGLGTAHLSRSTQSAAPGAVQPGVAHISRDIAERAGITMRNFYGSDTRKEFIIETTGNGSVIFDYDNDGWPDIFLPNGSTVEGFPKGKEPTGDLYHNNHDGTFTANVTEKAGLARARVGVRVAASAKF